MSKTFGSWDASIHTLPEQIKRIERARKKETSPLSIDLSTFTAVFPGSGKTPYNTDLDSCSCVDFQQHKLRVLH